MVYQFFIKIFLIKNNIVFDIQYLGIMGLFIKFRNNLKRRRRISVVDVNSTKQNRKPNNDLIENQIVDNDEDFVFNIDNFFIDKKEVNKNKYNDWIEKNIDSKIINENNFVSKDNKPNNEIPKDSIMNAIPFDVFGKRKVYSSFHNTPCEQKTIDQIKNNSNPESVDQNYNKNNTINDFSLNEKKSEINENLNSDLKSNDEIEDKITKLDDQKNLNNNDNDLSIKINESYIENKTQTLDFINNKNNLDNKLDINFESKLKSEINDSVNPYEEIEDLDLDIDLDEGEMSIERNIEKDKSIVLNQGFLQQEKKHDHIKNNDNHQNNNKLIVNNPLDFQTVSEIADKLNKPSSISKVDNKKIIKSKENELHKIVGELKIYVNEKINEGFEGPFRIFLDKKLSPFKHCRLDGSYFKQISLDDFKNDSNFEDIKKIFEKIYKLKKDPSVTGYIGELIFYKILTQKNDDGLPLFNNFISTFFKNITPRIFKNKKYDDLFKIDWKSLTNIKSDFDFGITFEQEILNKKVTMSNKTWNCEIKSTNNKFSRKYKKDNIKLTKEQMLSFLSNEVWQVFKIHGVDYEIKENVLIHKHKKPCIDIIKIDRSNFLEMVYKQKNENVLFI